MACAISAKENCPHCGDFYHIENPKISWIVARESLENEVIQQSSCEKCISRVCEAVKECFSLPEVFLNLEESCHLENRVEVLPEPKQKLVRFSIDYKQQHFKFFQNFSDVQLRSLFQLPDQTETKLYRSVLEELFERRQLSISLQVWFVVILRSLPAPADRNPIFLDNGPVRIALTPLGKWISPFPGHKEHLQLILQRICALRVSLPIEFWVEALSLSIRYCSEYDPSQPENISRQYARADFQMVVFLLDAMDESRVILPVEKFLEILSITSQDQLNYFLNRFLSEMSNKTVAFYLKELVCNLNLDPYLVFFSQSLIWLSNHKEKQELDAISNIFASKLRRQEHDRYTEIWMRILKATYCVGYNFSQPDCTQQYSKEDLDMVHLVLDFMSGCKLGVPIAAFLTTLPVVSADLSNFLFPTILAKLPMEDLVNYLFALASDSNLDPCLVFFSQILSWLIDHKEQKDLDEIFRLLSSKVSGIEEDRYTAFKCLIPPQYICFD